MKFINLKLLLLGLTTPLLCGSVFAFTLNQEEMDYLDNNALNQGSFSNVGSYQLYYNPSSLDLNYCVIFSGLVSNMPGSEYYAIYSSANGLSQGNGFIYQISYPFFIFCNHKYKDDYYINIVRDNSSFYSNLKFTVDKFRTVSADKIINGYLGFDVQGLLNDLSQCDTSVQQCLLDKETLSGSLASCNADKISLNNNIDSLTLQLQNCLGQSCEGSGDYGSGVYFNQYSLYWTDEETDYSTPITNNLFLPLGYKGKINEDNILSIAKINTLETAYQFADEDKPMVVNSMSLVMLFFLGTGLLIVAIMYLRRFISKK